MRDVRSDEYLINEMIRPSAIVPEEAARRILVELSLNNVLADGLWQAEPSRWTRYDRRWAGPSDPGSANLIGVIQVAYGTPTKYDITIYQVTITRYGDDNGWSVERLCDEALSFGGLTLQACPRAALSEPPKPFRF